MKKSYLCLLSFATSIIALTESINKNNLFSYMMLIISIIFLFLYDNVFYRNLRFNKGDIRSLIIQLPIMLLISCLLEIDLLVITLVCFISLKVSIEIKSMDKDDCIYYLKVIFIGFIIIKYEIVNSARTICARGLTENARSGASVSYARYIIPQILKSY